VIFSDDDSHDYSTMQCTCLTSLEAVNDRRLELGGLTHSFFLLAGNVGTNLSFCDPCLVTSEGFLARLPMALGVDSPGVLEDAPGSLVCLLSAIELEKSVVALDDEVEGVT